jgi:hypothetical protein
MPYTTDAQRVRALWRLVICPLRGAYLQGFLIQHSTGSDYGPLQILPWNWVARDYNSFDVKNTRSGRVRS